MPVCPVLIRLIEVGGPMIKAGSAVLWAWVMNGVKRKKLAELRFP